MQKNVSPVPSDEIAAPETRDAPALLTSRFRDAALWALVGAGASRALNMGAWFVCARVLGKEAFGHFSIVQSTSGALGVVSGLGLGLTATRYVAEWRKHQPARAGRVLALGYMLSITAGLLIATALMAAAPFLALHTLGDGALTTPLRLSTGLVFFGALNGFQTGALVGFEALRSLALAGFWSSLLSLPVIGMASSLHGVNGAVSGFVFLLAATAIACHLALKRECRRSGISLRLTGCLREFPLLLHFSLPALMGSALLSPAMWLCDTWLVHQHEGFVQLGLYGVADRWRLLILFLPASLAAPVLSLLASLQGAADHRGYRRIFRLNLLVILSSVVFLSLLAITFAPLLMRLFGRGYQGGAPILSILAFSAIAETANTFLGQRLVTRSMWTRFRFDALLVTTLVSTAWFLIPHFRAAGLAAAYASAFLVASLCLLTFERTGLGSEGGALNEMRKEGGEQLS